MRVFLTGANGYVGRILSERLVRLPEITRLTGIGRTPPPAPLPEPMSRNGPRSGVPGTDFESRPVRRLALPFARTRRDPDPP